MSGVAGVSGIRENASRQITPNPPRDSLGICLAGACAVHCLLAPVVGALLPVAGLALAGPAEWLFTFVSFGASATALGRGCFRVHRHKRALFPFGCGVALLLAGRVFDHTAGVPASGAVIGGAGLLVYAHIWNIRLCRERGTECCDDALTTGQPAVQGRLSSQQTG